jgi:hypothetical protein
MSKPMEEETNVVPLFRTFEELDHDEKQILADYHAEWEEAYKVYDAARAAIAADEAMLKKIDTTPVIDGRISAACAALAKAMPAQRSEIESIPSELAGLAAGAKLLKREFDIRFAERKALNTLAGSMKAAIAKRDDRLYGLGAIAKRSARFASSHNRPGAVMLPPSA